MKIIKKIKILKFNIKSNGVKFALKSLMLKKNRKYYEALNQKDYEKHLKELYFISSGRKLDLSNPKSFNEKLQWLKLNDLLEIKTDLTDKYKVKTYIKDKIGDEYNVKLLGKWDSFDAINFDELPEKFVLKTNHGSGMNVVVKNKEKINLQDLKYKFDNWLKINYAYEGCIEMQYKNIKPCIIAEEYLGEDLIDIQFWISNGKILFISYIENPHGGNYKISFDEDWNELDFVTSLPKLDKKIEKIQNFNELKNVAKILAADFKFVRVDFYITRDNDIKFSEMTFTPSGGFINWEPKETDYSFSDFNIK